MKQSKNQMSLFNDKSFIHHKTDKRYKNHPKHSHKHWTKERRLAYLIHHNSDITWDIALQLSKKYLIGLKNGKTLNRGHSVNKKRMGLGVQAMHSYEKLTPSQQKRSSRSISQIARKFHLSRRTLYRAYYKKYGK